MVGSTQGSVRKTYVKLREALLRNDLIRIGYEDEPWHQHIPINRAVPAKGQILLKAKPGKAPPKGTPVFLTDRRESALNEKINRLEKTLTRPIPNALGGSESKAVLPRPKRYLPRLTEISIHTSWAKRRSGSTSGIWLFSGILSRLPRRYYQTVWFWLPPVIWPQSEEIIQARVRKVIEHGGRQFVLNAPWQIGLFATTKGLDLWAGPFCNLANPLALQALIKLGYKGAFISPELGKTDCLNLPRQSPLPLGIVVSGNWPLCLSRIVADELTLDQPFVSPKGETAWIVPHDDIYWMYPNWKIDLTGQIPVLIRAGYRFLAHLNDPPPKGVAIKKRPGLWNWSIGLP